VVRTIIGKMAAEIIKGRLISAGIPAFLKYESISTSYAVTVDGLGQVQILVPAERERDARELLQEDSAGMAGHSKHRKRKTS
jgi:hypothetical protein